MLLQRLDRQEEVPDDGGWLLGLPDPAHNHQARMQPQAHGQQRLCRVPTRVRRQPLVQSPRGRQGTPGVILLGHRGAKEGQEARASHVVERPAIPLDLLLGQGVQGAHLTVERIEPRVRLERRGLGQATPEQRDQFALAVGHARDRGGGGSRGKGDARRG